MSEPFSRRKLITPGLAAAAGVFGMRVAARLADRPRGSNDGGI